MSAIGNVGARYRKQVLPRRLQKLAAVYDPEPTSAFNVYASIIRALQRPDSQTLGRLSNDPMGHWAPSDIESSTDRDRVGLGF
jgi:hypothetical protein